jgi:hypothetical protein
MREETAGWTATGLRWRDGRPVLTAARGELTHQRVVAPGTTIGWRLGGPRRCTGARTAAGHRPCPHGAEIAPAAKSAQCAPCQGADLGLALARDQIVDDGRTYRLYLAWFGTGLLKVGLTAEERGTARLQEQAALAYTFVGRGRLPAVRRAELTVAQAGLARERLTGRLKIDRWWGLPGAAERHVQLTELRAAVLRLLDGHGLELLPDGPVVDQCALFGLADGAPPAYRVVTALAAGATLGGLLRAPVGRYLFVDPSGTDPSGTNTSDTEPSGTDPSGTNASAAEATPLLLDTGLLTGWRLSATTPGPPSGVTLRACRRPEESGEQTALF